MKFYKIIFNISCSKYSYSGVIKEGRADDNLFMGLLNTLPKYNSIYNFNDLYNTLKNIKLPFETKGFVFKKLDFRYIDFRYKCSFDPITVFSKKFLYAISFEVIEYFPTLNELKNELSIKELNEYLKQNNFIPYN